MNGIIFFVSPLFLFLSYSGISQDNQTHNTVRELTFISESSDSISRISPVQQEYGVGRVSLGPPYPDQYCKLIDSPDVSTFGETYGAELYSWVIWDVSVIPADAEIIMIEIEHYIEPAPNYDGARYCYRKLDSLFLQPPDCIDAANILEDCSIYIYAEIGYLPRVVRYNLREAALADVSAAVARQGYFSIAFTKGVAVDTHLAMIRGWSAGGPELILTWRRVVAIESKSWGSIKSLKPLVN